MKISKVLKPKTSEAIKGIQQGLDNFEAGQFRSFEEFSQEQRRKYNLPV